jgi:hypothetical protein
MGNLKHNRIGFAGAHAKRAPAASCQTGGFYKSPANNQKVDSSKPFDISWDNSCLNASKVDIYLFAPTSQRSRIHVWENVDFKPGALQTTLKPKWWNATTSQSMQLTIIDAGSPPFLSTMPAGPVFTATWTPPPDGSIPNDANPNIPDTDISNSATGAVSSHAHLSNGKIAAAVLLPLLVIIAAIAIYMKMLRAKGIEKRKRWSEALDKRMSTISTDWRAMSGASANAAVRSSFAPQHTHPFAASSDRMSQFDYSAPRAPSLVATGGEYGQAGIGSRGMMYTHDNVPFDSQSPQMSQLRPGITPASFANRTSKVSFASTDPRMSIDSRRVTSRAFNSHLPPVPAAAATRAPMYRQNTMDVDSTQREGPLDLSSEDIRARLSGSLSEHRPSVDEVMPALSMMRTGEHPNNTNNGTTDDDYLLWEAPNTPTGPSTGTTTPTVPPPAALTDSHPTQTPSSTNMGLMPLAPNVMSPDEMLRAYAERRTGSADGHGGGGVRTLYSPATSSSSSPVGKSPKMLPGLLGKKSLKDKKGKRGSVGNEEAYGGTG